MITPRSEPSRVAHIRVVVIEHLSEPANSAPPPSPGFRAAGQSLFYVTAAGECWLVRDESARVQLAPAALPIDASVVGDDEIDDDIAAVAEAADTLEANRPEGFYQDSDVYYYVTLERGVVMVYGSQLAVVGLPSLPARATWTDLVPSAVQDAVAWEAAI